jgi:hypothetical protein
MATRIYFDPINAPSVSPAWIGTWEAGWEPNTRRSLVLDTKGDNGSTNFECDSSTSTSQVNLGIIQFVSEPLDSIATVNLNAIKAQFMFVEDNAKMNAYAMLYIGKCDSDGSNPTSWAGWVDGLEVDSGTIGNSGDYLNRNCAVADPGNGSLNQGDRLIIEIGVQAANAKSDPYTASVWITDNHATTDHFENDTTRAEYNVWAETGDTFSESTGGEDLNISIDTEESTISVQEWVDVAIELVPTVYDEVDVDAELGVTVDIEALDLDIDVYDEPSIEELITTEATCKYDDDFTGSDNDPPSVTKWTETDVDSIMSIQSNKLNFDYVGTVARQAYIDAKWFITADNDFDVRIDFSINSLESPDAGSNQITFLVGTLDSSEYVQISRAKSGTEDSYATLSDQDTPQWTGSTEGSGTLRIWSVSGVIKAAYYSGGDWIVARTFSSDFTGDNLYVKVRFNRNFSTASTDIDLDVDDFVLFTGCGGITAFCPIDLYDGVTVEEDVTVDVLDKAAFEINVYDEITADETVDLAFELVVDVFDSVTVEETVIVAPLLVIDLFDSVTVEEDVTVSVESVVEDVDINVFSSVGLDEYVESYHYIPHRYWRILTYANYKDAATTIAEVEMRGAENGSDLTGSGTPSASSSDHGAPANAFDDDTGTFWGTNGFNNVWLAYDFGAGNECDIRELTLTARDPSYFYQTPGSFHLQYSDDGTNWTSKWFWYLHHYTAGETKTFNSSNAIDIEGSPGSYRYFRVLVLRSVSSDITNAAEIELRQSVYGTDETGAGTPSADSFYGAGYEASKAFDDNDATMWVSSNTQYWHWIKYDFGDGNNKTIVEVSWRLRDDGQLTEAPIPMLFQASADDSTWVTVFHELVQPNWTTAELRTFPDPGYKIVSVYESVTVGEDITVSVSAAPDPQISVYDEITVEDEDTVEVEAAPPLEVDLYDEITATAVVTDIALELVPNVFDSVDIEEYVEIDFDLVPTVYDDITVNEYVDLAFELVINVYSDVTVEEDVTVDVLVVSTHEIDVFDSPSITENIDIAFDSFTSVFDSVDIEESIVTAFESFIDVYDEVSLEESISIAFDSFVSVYEEVSVDESVDLAFESYISVYDEISVDESTDQVFELVPNVYEDVTVDESVDLALELVIDVFDSVTVEEDVTVNVAVVTDLEIDLYDEVSVGESTDQAFELVLSVFDSVTIEESVSLGFESYIDVYDEVTIEESTDLAFELVVDTYDDVSTEENFTVILSLAINRIENVSVDEDVEFAEFIREISVVDTADIIEDITTYLPDALKIDTFDSPSILEDVTVNVNEPVFKLGLASNNSYPYDYFSLDDETDPITVAVELDQLGGDVTSDSILIYLIADDSFDLVVIDCPVKDTGVVWEFSDDDVDFDTELGLPSVVPGQTAIYARAVVANDGTITEDQIAADARVIGW